MPTKLRFPNLILHAIIGLLFLAMPLIFAPPMHREPGFLASLAMKKMLNNLILICYFYLNYLILLRFFFERKYIIFGFFTAICFCLSLTPGYFSSGRRFSSLRFGPDFEIASFLFIAVFFLSYSMRVNARLKDVENEKLTAQFSVLKAQVYPHFLFNTLNSIYAMAIKSAPDAATAIVKLSNLLRYTLTESDCDFVPLCDEIRFVENYVALQKYRLGATINVEFSVDGNVGNSQIIPMVLIPFVENAFKYGVAEQEVALISISIGVDQDTLQLFVRNKKAATVTKEFSTGIGVKNTVGRLKLSYPKKYRLTIDEDAVSYAVSLQIAMA